MGRGSIVVLAVSGMAVCGALATGPGLAFATASAAARPATAAAPEWGTAQGLAGAPVGDEDGAESEAALSCSSPGNCTVAGNYGGLAGGFSPTAFVANQRNGTWGKAIEVPGLAALNVGKVSGVETLSCASAGNCTAGGDYSPGGTDASGASPAFDAFAVTEKDGTWGGATEVPGTAALNTGHSAVVSSVSCWSAGDCTAAGVYAPVGVASPGVVDSQVFVVTEKDGAWGPATGLPGLAALNTGKQSASDSISCAAGANCAVGGYYTTASGQQEAFVADESAGTWHPAEEVPGSGALNGNGAAGVYGISCASAGNCGAIGYAASNSGEAFLASEINGTWRTATAIPGAINPLSISCPSAGNCVAGGSYLTSGHPSQGFQAFVMAEHNGTWGELQPVPGLVGLNIGQSAGIESMSCSAPGDCGAGGYYAAEKITKIAKPAKREEPTKIDQPPPPPGQAFVVTETDGTWGRAEEVPGSSALTAPDSTVLYAVSCVSPQACTATGVYGASGPGGIFVVSTKAPTATTGLLSARKVTYGDEQAVRVSAAVTAQTGALPAGKVTVTAGSATLCVITLRSGRGSCRLTARRLRPGTYGLTAAYPGSPDLVSSVSRAKPLTVVK
jgi:Bacterial Ig-like domain (group 3)